MATIRLVPSTYYLSNTSYLSVSNASNMYHDTDNTSYATVTNSQNGTTSYYAYIRGFNFDAIPRSAVINSFAIKIKVRESGITTSSSYYPRICNGTSTLTGSCSMPGSTAQVLTFSGLQVDFDTIRGYGSDFGIRLNCRRSNRNTTGYMYIYGAEIEVDYTLPTAATVTSTLTGDGTISPSGATATYEGAEYTLTITPATKSDPVTAKKNGSDITLIPHYGSGSLDETAESYTTELSSSNAHFYTASSTTGNYFNYAVGHTAESPGSTSSSYNTYVKDNNQNTATGWATYSFDFSGIPSGAIIDDVTVKCYGACESITHDSTHKAEVSLYCGTTQKGTTQNFSSTSNSIMTLSDVGTWTRAELQNAKLRFTVAYYGGRLFGITWTVTYHLEGDPEYYTYTYIVDGDAAIAVVIGTGAKLYVKVNGSWVQAIAVYKKVNGSWVQQSDLTNVFQSGTHYRKG